jgi:hypothetical protein
MAAISGLSIIPQLIVLKSNKTDGSNHPLIDWDPGNQLPVPTMIRNLFCFEVILQFIAL